jgi:hypothetical protein
MTYDHWKTTDPRDYEPEPEEAEPELVPLDGDEEHLYRADEDGSLAGDDRLAEHVSQLFAQYNVNGHDDDIDEAISDGVCNGDGRLYAQGLRDELAKRGLVIVPIYYVLGA